MFSKPISVYAMFFMLAIIAGIALYAHRQNVRNAILLERIDYYKLQISNFDSALAAHKTTCGQAEVLLQTTKESTAKLDQKGKELTKNLEDLKPQIENPRKADEPIIPKKDDGDSDRAMLDSMWQSYCKSTNSDPKCTKR